MMTAISSGFFETDLNFMLIGFEENFDLISSLTIFLVLDDSATLSSTFALLPLFSIHLKSNSSGPKPLSRTIPV